MRFSNGTRTDRCYNLLVVRVNGSGGEMMASCGMLPTVRRSGRFIFGNVHVRVRRGLFARTVGGHILVIV